MMNVILILVVGIGQLIVVMITMNVPKIVVILNSVVSTRILVPHVRLITNVKLTIAILLLDVLGTPSLAKVTAVLVMNVILLLVASVKLSLAMITMLALKMVAILILVVLTPLLIVTTKMNVLMNLVILPLDVPTPYTTVTIMMPVPLILVTVKRVATPNLLFVMIIANVLRTPAYLVLVVTMLLFPAMMDRLVLLTIANAKLDVYMTM
jgi:hypothetical protein